MTTERIIQNAYYVSDIDEGIALFHRFWGIGPFFVRRHIELENVTYRGSASELDISAAYTQSGDIMIELVTQHNDAPSIFRDRFAVNESGFHHVALDFGDHDARVGHFNGLGFASVTSFNTGEGRGATYLDTFDLLGHATEIYRVNDSLRRLYAIVRSAAETWDGQDLTVEL
ncbi:MAG: VOC family protein [Luminiphilus sp.]|jgi:hypothetical protein|nr:VOC family protein [Luminiphilus sp.]